MNPLKFVARLAMRNGASKGKIAYRCSIRRCCYKEIEPNNFLLNFSEPSSQDCSEKSEDQAAMAKAILRVCVKFFMEDILFANNLEPANLMF